jgi:hypothetical protein
MSILLTAREIRLPSQACNSCLYRVETAPTVSCFFSKWGKFLRYHVHRGILYRVVYYVMPTSTCSLTTYTPSKKTNPSGTSPFETRVGTRAFHPLEFLPLTDHSEDSTHVAVQHIQLGIL